MTTALATTADVATAIGRALSGAAETARATSLLLTATAQIESWTGHRFTPGSYTVTRFVYGKTQIILPGTVATVAGVREIDQSDGTVTTLVLTTDYTVRGNTVYFLGSRDVVEVDFTTTAAVPDEVVTLVAGIVARTLAGPPTGVASETAGPFSKSYVNNNGDVWLSKADKLVLGRYKPPTPAIDILG